MTDFTPIKGPDGNFLLFSWDVAKNAAATEAEGRPIYDKVLNVCIQSPGAPHQGHGAEVEREYADGRVKKSEAMYLRYGREIRQFKEMGAQAGDMKGTPVKEWPAIDVRQAAELVALNIYTVESLADLSDTGIQRLGHGGRSLVARAKAFLQSAGGNAVSEKLAAENAALREQIALLQGQVSEVTALVHASMQKDDEAPTGRASRLKAV